MTKNFDTGVDKLFSFNMVQTPVDAFELLHCFSNFWIEKKRDDIPQTPIFIILLAGRLCGIHCYMYWCAFTVWLHSDLVACVGCIDIF